MKIEILMEKDEFNNMIADYVKDNIDPGDPVNVHVNEKEIGVVLGELKMIDEDIFSVLDGTYGLDLKQFAIESMTKMPDGSLAIRLGDTN